jgi:hypothetical protein
MKIEINYVPQDDQYCAQICDGPDGIEEESFVCSSLGELFEKIIVWRTLIAQQYIKD